MSGSQAVYPHWWERTLFLGGSLIAGVVALWQGWPEWAAGLIGLAVFVVGHETGRAIILRRAGEPRPEITDTFPATPWERIWFPVAVASAIMVTAWMGWHWMVGGLFVVGLISLGYAAAWSLRILRQRRATPTP